MVRRIAMILLAAAACGGGGGTLDGGGIDGAGGSVDGAGASVDGAVASVCDGTGTSARYFPFTVGARWQYRVTDPMTGAVTTKLQTVDEMITPPGQDPVIVQTTTKSTGRTETWNRTVGEAVVRVRQQDFDQVGALELTTTYDPFDLRLDEAAEHVAQGAVWSLSYTEAHFDAAGAAIDAVPTTDEWTVVAVDEACSTALGALSCLHVSRVRTVGGVADKEFWYARGVGKVKETGGQTEELTGCTLP